MKLTVRSRRVAAAAVVLGSFVAEHIDGFLVTRPPVSARSQSRLIQEGGREVTTTSLVANAERTGTQSHRRFGNPFQKWEWTRTIDAGFLPKLGRKRPHQQQQQLQPEDPPSTAVFAGSNDVLEIEGIHEYKEHVVDEKQQMVCVRFYASWCRSCKAVGPAFRRLVKEFPKIKFVEVPVTNANTFLHKGLGIPSLPFAHIYHPDVGLVEERKIGKKDFKHFRDEVLRSYFDGFCMLKDGERYEAAPTPAAA